MTPHRRLTKFTLPLAAIALLPVLTGCGMGGRIGHNYLRGSVSDASGKPMPDYALQFVAPEEHDYGEIVLELNDYRRFPFGEELLKSTTDDKGNFYQNIGGSLYRGVCLLPFLCYPVHPPAPPIIFRDPRFPRELFVLRTRDGDITALNEKGAPIPLSQTRLARVDVRKEHGRWYGGPRKTTVYLDFRLRNIKIE